MDKPQLPARYPARCLASGLLALLGGLLLYWGQFGGLAESLLHLWHRHVLPAFYSLHASGLTFCF